MYTMIEPIDDRKVMALETRPATTMAIILMTLYDLIAAVQNAVASDDDALVVTRVVNLIRAGRVMWHGDDTAFTE